MNPAATVHTADGHRIFVRVNGTHHGNAPVVCLPGLTRNSRDFTRLAERIASTDAPFPRLVLRVDFRGRGNSSADPTGTTYEPATYAADVVSVLDTFGIERAVLIGTSLGGSVSMVVNATQRSRVAGVVLNDVGPKLEPAGFAAIQAYAGKLGSSATWEAAEAQVRSLSGGLSGHLTAEDWRRVTRERYREFGPGDIRPDHHPGIVAGIDEADAHNLPTTWPLFDALADTPTLVIRGAESDLFAADTLEEMHRRNAELRSATVPNRGHCPFLDEPEAVGAIDQFLGQIDS